jgi:uncharacterized protein YjiS (DUF1127 family)
MFKYVWKEGIHMLKRIWNSLKTWYANQVAVVELRSLTDRELADIGVHRDNIGIDARANLRFVDTWR